MITVDFPPNHGGVAAYWKQVVLSLPVEKMSILTNNPIPKDLIKEGRYNRRLFFRLLWPKWFKGVMAIHTVARKTGAEQMLAGQLLPVGSMAWLYHRLTGMPYYVQVYGMDVQQAKLSARKTALARRVLKEAKGVIANSKAVAELVKEFCPQQENVSVIYPVPEMLKKPKQSVIDEILFRYQLGDRPVVLTIGRLVERKGQDKVLAAMLHVWQRFPDAVYVLVGEGPDRSRLQKMAAPHMEKVIFTGSVSEQEKCAWLSIADLFVMIPRQIPGDIEGFGMVYLEANAMALPVIAGDSGGVKEAVINGETGVLVNPDDSDILAQTILDLLQDPAKAKSLGERGKQRVLHEFTWGTEIEKLKEFLK